MIVYRLSKSRYARDLSGRGAEKSGGRWNSKGTAMLYTSSSRALCTTEIAVHTPLGILPTDYAIITIEIPDTVKILETGNLPYDWKSVPPGHSTQSIGDEFISQKKYLIMKVPSVVVPGDYNYLLNPSHPDFHLVKIKGAEPFAFDERLFKH